MVTDSDGNLPAVPAADLVLDLRSVRAYLARDGEDVVLVLEDEDGCGVSLEPGIGGNCQDAIDGAARIGRLAYEYAGMLRAQAARRSGG